MAKVSEKLRKVDDSVTINFYDNGYMVDVSGRDFNDDYSSSKIICESLEQVYKLLDEISTMENT